MVYISVRLHLSNSYEIFAVNKYILKQNILKWQTVSNKVTLISAFDVQESMKWYQVALKILECKW